MGLTGHFGQPDTLSGTLAGQLLRGYSAYDIAKVLGYEGTKEEWIASLKGAKGDLGDTGTGITDITLNDDYTLTIGLSDGTDYTTEPIRGEQGEKGDTGPKGDAYILTAQDKADIYNLLLNDYPAVEEVSF